MTGIFVSRKGGVIKPMRNLEVSAGGVVERDWPGMVRVGSCRGEVAVVGVAGPLAERNGCPGEEGIRGTAAEKWLR